MTVEQKPLTVFICEGEEEGEELLHSVGVIAIGDLQLTKLS